MKNKKVVMTFAVILFLLPLLAISYVSANEPEDAVSLASKAGKMFNEYHKNQERTVDLYAVGKNTTIAQRDVDQAKEFYVISGMSEDEAKAKAEEYIYGREALYYKAVQEGYQVTDEEVQQYIEECKVTVKEISNSDEIQAIIDQYDSEEDYWNHQVEVYQKNLPCQKYVKALETEFWSLSKEQYSNAEDTDKEWVEYFNTFKKNLVIEEEYEVVTK